MAVEAIMSGPDGAEVRAYRRSVRQLRAGDWLPEHSAHVVTDAVTDPDDGSVWVTLETGQDLRLTTRKVWIYRRYTAPEWMTTAVRAYRDARDARNALRESGTIVPAGSVAGAGSTAVACYQLTDAEFRATYPPPRLADFIRDAADAHRTPERVG